VRTGDLERVHRGVLSAPAARCDPASRASLEATNLRIARASALTCPRAAISHLSAAIALELPTIGDLGRPCLTVPAGTALRSLADIHLHRAGVVEVDATQLDGYAVMRPARTIMDVAREHGVPAAVVAADCALHRGLVDESELADAYEVCARWPGRKAARITLLSVDGAAESPLESLSRLRIAACGLPAPRSQAVICDERGRHLGRSDFYWDEFGVVGEADGNFKYERGQAAIVEERHRQKLFEETGLIVVRWGWPDLFRFGAVASRLSAAFARGARPGSALRRWAILRPTARLHPQQRLSPRNPTS
jgi:hypothetical protein